MTWISNSITFLGLALLAHACYSAHEYSALQSFRAAKAASAALVATPAASLPVDISIETIVATAVVCLGLALGTSLLQPIQWRVWAGKVEREGEEGFLDAGGEVSKAYVGNPFSYLETRPAFMDVRKRRADFAQWVKDGEKK